MQTKPERSPRKSLEAAKKRREMYKIMHIEVETKSRNLLEAWANREKIPTWTPSELRENCNRSRDEAEKITPTIERTENEVRERTHFKLLELASVEKSYDLYRPYA